MAWTAPATVITGDLLTAALWNAQVRDNMLETAPAKGTAAGLVYPNGANSLALLAASGNGGKFLRFNAGATAVEAAAAPYSVAGSDVGAESTTTSTGDLKTVSGLTIPTTSLIVVEFDMRRSGSGNAITLGFKLNSTELVTGGGMSSSTTNEAMSGHARLVLGRRDNASYLRNGLIQFHWRGATGGNNGAAGILAEQPSAEVTGVTVTVIGNVGGETVGVKNLTVYAVPSS